MGGNITCAVHARITGMPAIAELGSSSASELTCPSSRAWVVAA